jgi:nucleoside-diphosphate-sugar epimerase
MSSKPFLIRGATGSIGRNVVEFLLERGHKVRAFVHKGENNEQSSQLQQLGAEIAVGDLLDFMTLLVSLQTYSSGSISHAVCNCRTSKFTNPFSITTISKWMASLIFARRPPD